MSTAATSGAAAAIAAAAAKKRREEEEERMVTYDKNDLDGWEFKFVRSYLGRFGNQKIFRRVIDEEARAGWELVEKFDDHRIRFKRRVTKRADDQYLDFDPYRTSGGLGEGKLVMMIVGICVLVAGVGILVALLATR